jgi:stearoyl-CoA desaturase (delta-9 desaturase)
MSLKTTVESSAAPGTATVPNRRREFNFSNGVAPTSTASPNAHRNILITAGTVIVLPFLCTVFAIVSLFVRGITAYELALCIGFYSLTMLGINVGFHRHFAHNSFKTSSVMRIILAILGSMAGQGPLFWWVAVHRRHHRHSDGPGDPHSPNLVEGTGWKRELKGFWYGHIRWMLSKEITNWVHFAPDLLKDRSLFFMHRTYFLWLALGLAIPTSIAGAVSGTWTGAFYGLIWGGFVRMCLVDHALWFVGSISHMFGTRPFAAATRDRSCNNYFVALVAFGEGLQNNHHAFPNSANHRVWWWEPDFAADVIRLLRIFGLIWNVKTPSASAITKAKGTPGIIEL